MIGGLLKIAGQMAAWGVSVSATAGVAKWMGSRLSQAATNYAVRGAQSIRVRDRITRGLLTHLTGRANPKSQVERARTLMSASRARAHSSYSQAIRRFNEKGRRNAGFFMRTMRDEALALPMNYTMYRLERHKAVSPEEREQTESFRKWYMGTPMAMSVGIGFAMERMRHGRTMRAATAKLAKKLGSSRVKSALRPFATHGGSSSKALYSAGKTYQNVTSRLGRMARAKFVATEGRPMLGMLGTMGPVALTKKIWDAYKSEVVHVAGGDRSVFLDRVMRDHESLLETTKQMSLRRVADGEFSNKEASAYVKTMTSKISDLTRMRVDKFRDKIVSKNRFTQFWNNMVKSLKDPSAQLNPEMMQVDGKWSKVLNRNETIPTGRYILGGKMNENGLITGGTTIDFGALSIARVKDMALGMATKGTMGKFLHLFGARDVLAAKDSEHAMVGAVTMTGSNPLYFPMAYFDESGEYSAKDIMAQMMGFHDYGSAQKADRTKIEDFLNTRLDIYQREYGIKDDRQILEKAFLASARHGELKMKADDMLIHQPGGRLQILTMQKKDQMWQPLSVDVGGFNGQLLEFMKFTREHDSVPAKLIRSFTGYEKASYTAAAGGVVDVTHGIGMLGKIVDAASMEEQQGLMYKLKNLLDFGYAQDRSIFTRVKSIFTKHTDPRYPTTFFSKDFVGSPEWKDKLIRGERSREDLVEFFRTQADNAMNEYWQGAVRRYGGSDEVVQVFKELSQKHADKGMGGFADYMITKNTSVGEAKRTVDDLLEAIKAFPDIDSDPGELRRHFMFRDIEDLKAIRRMFTAPTGKTVLDVMGHISSRRRTVFGGRWTAPNKLDEYNALVLRLETGIYQSGRLPVVPETSKMIGVMRDFGDLPAPLTNAERSAWYAGSHLAREYHNLASIVNEATEGALSDNSKGRIMGILDSVANVNGATYKDITRYYRKRKRFAPWAMWDYDHRMKWEDSHNVKTGIYLVPKKTTHGFVSKETVPLGSGEELSIARGVMDASNISVMSMFHAFNRAASEMLGIGFDETNLSTPFQYFEKMLFQRVVPFTAMYMGYSVLDRLADRYMDGTPFGEGLTTFGANVLAGARVGAQGFLDVTGATGIASYMEDLMPGIVTSPMGGLTRGIAPLGAGMSIGMRMAGPRGALTGGIVGSAVSMLVGGGPLGAFGMWDISKTRSELVQELLGEKQVPVRKGRWWELSSSPFEGTRIQYYRPHIYSLMRSDYKETPGFKDSLFTEMVGNIAPDWYAMKNYYSRPYPVTAGLFSNLPVFGNMFDLMASTTSLGRLASLRGIPMHRGEESPLYMQRMGEETGFSSETVARDFVSREGYFSQTDGSAGTSVGAMMSSYTGQSPVQAGTTANYTAAPMMRSSFEWGLGESVENVKDIVGIRGFMLGSMFENMTGRKSLFDYAPQLASPVEIPGIQREYWDYELGGILGMSEIIRRYINPKRGNMEIYNPIRNTMPPWLPGHDYYIDFQHGDPYTMVPMGEARLPGASYETLHDVDLTMPITSEIMGESAETQASYYLGIPNYMAERNRAMEVAKEIAISYRADAQKYGELLSEERTVYNVNFDASATVDAIVSQKRSGSYIPVKVVPKGFAGQSNLNAFLVMADVDKGILVEVDPRSGGISERIVKKDVKRFTRDIKAATAARTLAYNQVTSLEDENKAFNLANAYSWFDRYRILADVAHYSREYREAKSIVRKQINAGRLPVDKISEFEMIEEQVENKKKAFEFSEYRFKDLGEGLTPYTKARDRFVEDEYNTLEQNVGALWERASHIRNPLQSKFYHNLDALEEYERNAIYGKTLKMWQNPIEDWVKSYYLSAVGEDNPVQASVNWATAGYLLGGGPLAALGASAGGAFTSIMNLGDEAYIPERTMKVRDIVSQADAVKYSKYMKLYQETGDEQYLSKANRTLTGKSLEGEALTARKIGRSLGRPEKDYVEDIINNVTRSNISRVTQLLPTPAVASVYHTMGEVGYAEDMMRQFSRAQKERYVPSMDSPIYSADVPIEAPIISSFEQEGLNAHDAGYGWYSQMAQIERLKSMGVYGGEGIYNEFGSRVSVKSFERSLSTTESIRKLLSRFSTNVQITQDGSDRVEVEIITR